MINSFPHYRLLDAMDCGLTCLGMIAKHYGRSYTLQSLCERSFITREGVTNYGKDLPTSQEMKATADIITEDLRLIERLFQPLKKVLREGF